MTARRNGMQWRAVLIIVGLLVTGMSAVASPASATVRNWQIISKSSDSTSDNKGVTVTCPDGTQRLGTGADVAGAGRDAVIIDDLVPGPQNVSAYAYEYIHGTKEPWVLRVWAVCGNMGSTVLSVRQSSDYNVEAWKEVTASCPSPMVVIGTGFHLASAYGNALVRTVTPTRDSVTVKASAVDLNGPLGAWSVWAHAICADDPGDRTQVSDTILPSSNTLQLGAASCPSGTRSFGGGFALNGFLGRLNINNFIPASTGVVTLASELIATTNDWSITTHTICMSADLP